MIGLRKFRVVSVDAHRRGTRDESLRESAWEAIREDDTCPSCSLNEWTCSGIFTSFFVHAILNII